MSSGTIPSAVSRPPSLLETALADLQDQQFQLSHAVILLRDRLQSLIGPDGSGSCKDAEPVPVNMKSELVNRIEERASSAKWTRLEILEILENLQI